MRSALVLPFLVVMALGAGAEAYAARNVTRFALRFGPTEVLGRTSPVRVPDSWKGSPISFVVRDKRQTGAGIVGTRTDDGDDLYRLHALNDVRVFVQVAVGEILRQWGFSLGGQPDMESLQENGIYRQNILVVELEMLRVVETNQAVGATYVGEVGLTAEFFPMGRSTSVRSSAHGDATRYGKKFSNENCNEVLSDALLEATGNLMEGLVRESAVADNHGSSQSGELSSSAAGAGDSGLITPEFLLSEILMLKSSGLSEELLDSFIHGRVLTRPLTAAEVLHFKAVLQSDRLLQAVLSQPYGKKRSADDGFTGARP